MNSLYLLRMINYGAFIFSISNFILNRNVDSSYSSMLYIWSVIFSFIITFLYKRKNNLYYILSALIFMPLIFQRDINSILYVLLNNFYLLYISFVKTKEFRYYAYIDEFKRSLAVLSLLFFIGIIGSTLSFLCIVSIPYIIIYLISGVVLLRLLRYIENIGGESEQFAGKLNYIVPLMLLFFSFILSYGKFREGIFNLFRGVYLVIANIISYVLIPFAMIFGFFINILMNFLKGKPKRGNPFNEEGSLDVVDVDKIREKLTSREFLTNKLFISFVLIVFIILILILIIKYVNRKVKTIEGNVRDDFKEEKEYLIKGNFGKKIKDGIISVLTRKSDENIIRNYYKKFIKIIKSSGIEIGYGDTTKDINLKSKGIYEETALFSIRKLYIKVRYGNKKVDKNDINEMDKLLREHK